MKNIAVMGAGNVGTYAAKAVLEAEDMHLCGFIRREEEPVPGFDGVQVASCAEKLLQKPDGVIICVPSRRTAAAAKYLLSLGINTVDACDLHKELLSIKKELSAAAVKGGAFAVVGAGWDPGLDSSVRALLAAALPCGVVYTQFGPGISMGHTAAVKAIEGVADAVSITLPAGGNSHRRRVFVVLKPGANPAAVEHAIHTDSYFEHDETEIIFTNDISPYKGCAHGVKIERCCCAPGEEEQRIIFEMSINNPKLTAGLMLAAMRAGFFQRPGCSFFSELSPAELFPGFYSENIL